MNRIIDDSILTDIADAIREKNGTDNQYEDVEMPQAIRDIQSGSGEEFVGIKYSDFIDLGNGVLMATVADARSFEGHLPNMHRAAYMFANVSANDNGGYNGRLKTVYMPSGIDQMTATFSHCYSLENIYGDLSEVTDLYATFQNCSSLKSVPYMPNLAGLGANAFAGCKSLTSITLYKVAISIQFNTFLNCTGLTDFNIPQGWNINLYLHQSPKLTQECLHRIIENYADMTGKTAPVFQMGATNLAKVDEEHKAMATAKNVTLA